MSFLNVKIVVDSSADMTELSEVPFASAPLKIITSEKEYVDDAALDVEGMVADLGAYQGRSSTACPGPGDWLNAFGDAKYVFCVCITSALSGSYNAACVAKQLYEEQYPERRVFVLDSLSTGPAMRILVEKAKQWIGEFKPFEEICRALKEYQAKTGLLFMLESMRNLANNGRVNPLLAKAAGLLGIRAVGKASDKGELQMLEKCRGEKKALSALAKHLQNTGDLCKKIWIGHCMNESAALQLKERLLALKQSAEIEIYKLRGLCSFYAEKGGLLIGFERKQEQM